MNSHDAVMQTRCPYCQTTFRVTEQHLAIAGGQVRCGRCQQVFNGRDYIIPVVSEAVAEEPLPERDDWLERTDPDDFEHIDLSSSAGDLQALTEHETIPYTPETDMTALFASKDAEQDSADSERLDAPEVNEPRPAAEPKQGFNYNTATLEPLESGVSTETADPPADDVAEVTIPGAFIGHQEEEPTELGIGPAYEDDKRLSSREEEGIDHLFAEVQQQLEGGAGETETHEADAFDSVLGYIEELENTQQASVEVREERPEPLNPFLDPASPASAPNKEPDVPYSLRESMQALHKGNRGPLATAILSIVILGLLLGLLAQLVVFRSYDLAHSTPWLRPLLAKACRSIPCVYSGPRAPDKIQLLNRDVRVHPKNQQALLITATVVNQAGHAQPYPDVQITLSDLGGDIVAQRRFVPGDYLKVDEQQFRLMRPDIPSLIHLEVLDPGSDAVNFEFSFL